MDVPAIRPGAAQAAPDIAPNDAEPGADAELPRVLADRLTFGLLAVVDGYGEDAAGEYRQALVRRRLASPSSRRDVSIQVPFEALGTRGAIKADLALTGGWPGQLIIKSDTGIELNGMALLRELLGPEASGGPGVDGGLNVVGPTEGREAELLRAQLAMIDAALEALGDAMEAALRPEAQVVEQQLWLRSAEAMVDLAVPDPQRVARALRWAPLPGATEATLDVHLSRAETPTRGSPAATWRCGGGVTAKAYAKRPADGILRVEAAGVARRDIRKLTGGARLEFAGEDARALVLGFLRSVEPSVLALADHVRAVAGGGRTRGETFQALLPLFQVARGEQAGRGPRLTADTRAAAWLAFEGLLATGMCRPLKAPPKGRLRSVLDQLAAPGGPLIRQGRLAIYVLRPEYASLHRVTRASGRRPSPPRARAAAAELPGKAEGAPASGVTAATRMPRTAAGSSRRPWLGAASKLGAGTATSAGKAGRVPARAGSSPTLGATRDRTGRDRPSRL